MYFYMRACVSACARVNDNVLLAFERCLKSGFCILCFVLSSVRSLDVVLFLVHLLHLIPVSNRKKNHLQCIGTD